VFALVGALALGFDPALLGPLNWLDLVLVRWLGVVCFILSIPIIMFAQMQMGKSWRIGIDQQRKTELVTDGIFAHSRNPIFLGMRINLLGLFLILPNCATFAIWTAGELLMGVQVRLEEAHLSQANGAEYARYSQKVRRWI
jgi:protein-S-isoprenylcysteine O-methyltransferase Ste14